MCSSISQITHLAEWALRWQRRRSLKNIVDPHLRGEYSPESMEKLGEITEKCLADEGRNMPTMGEVLWHLEYVLHLHEAWLCANTNNNTNSSGGRGSSGDGKKSSPKVGSLEGQPHPGLDTDIGSAEGNKGFESAATANVDQKDRPESG